MGLRPLACWDYGFESRYGHGCLSLVSVVYDGPIIRPEESDRV